MNETGGERETLFPSTGKVPRQLFLPFGEPEFLGAFPHCLPAVLHPVHARDEIEILFNAQILPETESLRHVTDFAFDCFTLRNHVVAQNLSVAVIGAKQSAQHSEKSRLAATVRAEEPVDFARAHRKIDVIDLSKLAKPFRHPTNLYNCFAVFHFDFNATSTG